MTERQKLPNRRHGITMPVTHRGQTFSCTFGFGPDCRVQEAFMRSTKEGNDFSALMVDACIAASLLLQHGLTMADLVKAFGSTESDAPQSALGAIARVGADLDIRAETCKSENPQI